MYVVRVAVDNAKYPGHILACFPDAQPHNFNGGQRWFYRTVANPGQAIVDSINCQEHFHKWDDDDKVIVDQLDISFHTPWNPPVVT